MTDDDTTTPCDQPVPATARGRNEIMLAVLATAWLSSVALLAAWAVHPKTVTIDEIHHLPAGCLTLRTGEFFMHPKTPPLARCWSALGCWPQDPVVPQDPRWKELAPGWGPWMYGTAFYLRNREKYDRLYFRGRVANTVWLLPLGLSLFAWARLLHGGYGAAIALLLLGLSPSFLAHSPLVTTDLAATATYFSATYFFWRSGVQRKSWYYPLTAGVLLGAGLLSKFTLILLPCAWMLILAAQGLRRLWEARKQSDDVETMTPKDAARRALRTLSVRWAFPVVLALIIVNVGYGCQGTCSSARALKCRSRIFRELQDSWLGRMPLPLPRAFILGLDSQRADSESGEFPSYLMGRWSADARYGYYATVILLKTPTALLVLLLLTFTWRRPKRARSPEATWTRFCTLIPPLLLFFILSFVNRLNLGVRYLLPVLPFIYLHIAAIAGPSSQSRLRRNGVLACLLWYAVSSLAAHPDYLSYFTEVAGGSRQGHRYLLDSNIDWGQDLHRLADEMAERNIDHVRLAYFGHVPPEHYGIRHELLGARPENGYIAASVSYVMGQPYAITYIDGEVKTIPLDHYAWLRDHTPIARVGQSIWLYRIEPDAPARR